GGPSMILRNCAVVLFLVTTHARVEAAPSPSPIGPQNAPVDRSVYQVRFVSQATGSDSTGDGSQSKPLASLQAALAKITDASAERRYAIFVASGTYRGATVAMKPFVDLYGGHDPKTWQRDIVAQPSVLDGE